ncbi:NAD(P)H-dependent oxidoreductase [soil metagenome]
MTEIDKPKHVVILCHPESESFNASIAKAYCAAVEQSGQQAILRDLYRMDFDPVLKANEQPTSPTFSVSPHVAHELDLIADAAFVVFIYPVWFGTAPAMLKGYIERVLGSGISYRAMHEQSTTALSGTHLLSLTTSGNSRTWIEGRENWESVLKVSDQYLQQAFSMASCEHVHFSAIEDGLSEALGQHHIEDARQAAKKACAVAEEEHRHRHR